MIHAVQKKCVYLPKSRSLSTCRSRTFGERGLLLRLLFAVGFWSKKPKESRRTEKRKMTSHLVFAFVSFAGLFLALWLPSAHGTSSAGVAMKDYLDLAQGWSFWFIEAFNGNWFGRGYFKTWAPGGTATVRIALVSSSDATAVANCIRYGGSYCIFSVFDDTISTASPAVDSGDVNVGSATGAKWVVYGVYCSSTGSSGMPVYI